MQNGFNIEKCNFEHDCTNYESMHEYLKTEACMFYIRCKRAGLSREEMIDLIPKVSN